MPHAGETISEEYITEYSTDKIEMHTGAIEQGQRVLLVSRDVTGDRLAAAAASAAALRT